MSATKDADKEATTGATDDDGSGVLRVGAAVDLLPIEYVTGRGKDVLFAGAAAGSSNKAFSAVEATDSGSEMFSVRAAAGGDTNTLLIGRFSAKFEDAPSDSGGSAGSISPDRSCADSTGLLSVMTPFPEASSMTISPNAPS